MFEKSLKGPIIYVRHAQTIYNKICIDKEKELKTLDFVVFEEKWSKDLVDTSISEEGVNQTKILAQKIKDLNVTYVFVSPLNRCIETMYQSLKDHQNYNKLIIYVHPLLNERICSSCDLSIKIEDKKKLFSNINLNFDYFDEYCSNSNINNDYFYTDFINYDKNKIIPNEYDKNIVNIIEYMRNTFTKRGDGIDGIEDNNCLFKRVSNFKDFLKRFKQDKKIEGDEKVLVYTHSKFIEMSTSKIALNLTSVDIIPEDAYNVDNCEAVTMELL